MRLERIERGGRQVDVALVRLVDAVQKVQRERADVFAPLGQRRQADRDHVEPVEQVTPEVAARHLDRQVAVRRRDQPHVHRQLALAAEPHDRALLQGAQQLGLHQQRQLADLVEKDRAAVGLLEPAGARGVGAGEGAAVVAEEFGFEQRLGDGGAVDLDERRVAAAAREVHGACEQLLAGARFAEQQHARRGLRDALQFSQRLQQRGRGADDPVTRRGRFERPGQQRVAGFECARLFLDQRLQLQQLAGERRENLEHRHVVVEQPVAAADAVHAEHADGAAVHLDRQRDEGDRFLRQPFARDGAAQKARLGVDVLHDDRLAGGEHRAGDAFAGGVAAERHLGLRQTVGEADRRRAGRHRVVTVGEHDAATVQPEQFRQQVQHLAQHHFGREAAPDEAHHFAHQQQFLGAPGRVGCDRWRAHARHSAKSAPCVSPRGGIGLARGRSALGPRTVLRITKDDHAIAPPESLQGE